VSITPVIRLKFGEDTFDVVKLMASEVSKIQLWTGFGSKREWISQLGEENIDAFRAGYTLMLQRRGENVKFSEVDFDTDTLEAQSVDGRNGREIEPVLVLDEDGDPKLNGKGEPIPVRDERGDVTWRYTDDGSAVPPTEQA
jgi:hypothetical protein